MVDIDYVSDTSTISTEEVSGKILTLMVYPEQPIHSDDITSCRRSGDYISPIDALEVYQPCSRRTATKLAASH